MDKNCIVVNGIILYCKSFSDIILWKLRIESF